MRWIVLVAFCSTAFAAAAQDSVVSRPWSLTWKPLGAVDPIFANLTLGFDHFFHPNWSVDADAGFIRSWNRTPDESLPPVSTGVKVSASLRYHLKAKKQWPYIGVHVYHNRFKRATSEYVWRQGRAYQEDIPLYEGMRVYGGQLIVGVVFEDKLGRMWCDIYSGYGPRYREALESGLPDDGERIPQERRYNPFTEFDGNLLPSISAGIRIGYRL